MQTHLTAALQASLDQRHIRAVQLALQAAAPEALAKLLKGEKGGPASAVSDRASKYLTWFEAQAIAPQQDFEIVRCRHLRGLASVLVAELHVTPTEAKRRVDYYASVLDSAIIRATNYQPGLRITCGRQVSCRPLRTLSESAESAYHIREEILFSLPRSIAEVAHKNMPQLEHTFGPMLDNVNALRPQLDDMRASSREELCKQQTALIATYYLDYDVVRAMHALYEIQGAGERVVLALRDNVRSARAEGVTEFSHHQLKPAKRDMAAVLERIGKYTPEKAATEVEDFVSAIRGLGILQDKGVGPAPSR